MELVKGKWKRTAGVVGGRLVDSGVWKQLKKVFQEGSDLVTLIAADGSDKIRELTIGLASIEVIGNLKKYGFTVMERAQA